MIERYGNSSEIYAVDCLRRIGRRPPTVLSGGHERHAESGCLPLRKNGSDHYLGNRSHGHTCAAEIL